MCKLFRFFIDFLLNHSTIILFLLVFTKVCKGLREYFVMSNAISKLLYDYHTTRMTWQYKSTIESVLVKRKTIADFHCHALYDSH